METLTKKQKDQCNRLKQVRLILKLKQKDMAAQLFITQGHLSDIENGRKAISEKIAEMALLKLNISKEWFMDGIGEMFLIRTESEEIADFLGQLLKNEKDDEFKRRFISALSRMNESGWNALEQFLDNINEK